MVSAISHGPVVIPGAVKWALVIEWALLSISVIPCGLC